MGKTHVMVDIETFGNKEDAVILGIGAVRFNPFDPNEPMERFAVNIDLGSNLYHKRVIDPDTFEWWMKSEQADAFAVWRDDEEKTDLTSALWGFRQWVVNIGPELGGVWGNGATFDNVILAHAYRTTGVQTPWSFKHDRCFRTLKNMAPDIKPVNVGLAHVHVDDAEAQAKWLQEIVKIYGLVAL